MVFYGEQNKSRWEGGKKNKKGINIFFKKRVFKGGQIVPPLNKSPRTPLLVYEQKQNFGLAHVQMRN